MKATNVKPLFTSTEVKFCHHCGLATARPYAMESGNKYFCQRNCWEEYRGTQAPRYPIGHVHATQQ